MSSKDVNQVVAEKLAKAANKCNKRNSSLSAVFMYWNKAEKKYTSNVLIMPRGLDYIECWGKFLDNLFWHESQCGTIENLTTWKDIEVRQMPWFIDLKNGKVVPYTNGLKSAGFVVDCADHLAKFLDRIEELSKTQKEVKK